MTAQRYHCYLEAYESVHSETVLAESPEDAAVQAAMATELDGAWTVVPGEPVTVKVSRRSIYEADSVGSEP